MAQSEGKKAVTFFEKKVTKKTFAPAGVGTGIAVNRHFQWRLTAIPVPTPAGAKVFCALFFKKALLSSDLDSNQSESRPTMRSSFILDRGTLPDFALPPFWPAGFFCTAMARLTPP